MESQNTDRTTGELNHGPFQPFEHANKQMRRATSWWWLYALLGLVSVALGVTALASRPTAIEAKPARIPTQVSRRIVVANTISATPV